MAKSRKRLVESTTPAKQVDALIDKIKGSEDPSQRDISELRKLVLSNPELWNSAKVLVRTARARLIQKMFDSDQLTQTYVNTEMDLVKRELDYKNAPELERLLIDQIILARLRFLLTECEYTEKISNSSVSVDTALYWDRLLTSCHRRHGRAIETLARVRKLARTTPALQINIAGNGGRQINMQN